VLPTAEVPLVVPGHVPGLVLDMSALGSRELARVELVRALRPLSAGYPGVAGTTNETENRSRDVAVLMA